jgi:hypothetical protein
MTNVALTEPTAAPADKTYIFLVSVNKKKRIRTFTKKVLAESYWKQVKMTGFQYNILICKTGSKEEKEFMEEALEAKDLGIVSDIQIAE